jgi:hypothetical protein
MKKLVFALCVCFGAVVAVNAQDSTSTPSPTDPSSTTTQQTSPSTQDQGRVKIKSQELPDAVKSSLESQEYRGWLVNSAYKMDASSTSSTGNDSSTGATGNGSSTGSTGNESDSTGVSGNASTGAYAKEVYIVELKNGAQTKTIRFDKDGKKLDDGGMENDQK